MTSPVEGVRRREIHLGPAFYWAVANVWLFAAIYCGAVLVRSHDRPTVSLVVLFTVQGVIRTAGLCLGAIRGGVYSTVDGCVVVRNLFLEYSIQSDRIDGIVGFTGFWHSGDPLRLVVDDGEWVPVLYVGRRAAERPPNPILGIPVEFRRYELARDLTEGRWSNNGASVRRFVRPWSPVRLTNPRR